jgi:L-malate glycosyltransferase
MRIVLLAWQGSWHTRRWASFFAARGHDVHVVTCGDAQADDSPYAVHDLGRPRGGKAGYLAKIPRARRLVRSLRPDVLHAHFATSYGLLGAATGVRPFVVTAHGSDVLRSPRNPVMRAIVARVLRSADHVTVPAEHMREAVLRLLGRASTPIEVFQYGVEAERLAAVGRAARGERGATASHGVRVVSARPLAPVYRVDVFVRALALLRARGVDARGDVAGEGPERGALEALGRELGLADAIAFHGQIAAPELERLLAEADVYVTAAESDGASIALLEAMAVGTVPVVSDIAANRLWIDEGVNGVVTPIEPGAVGDAIGRALTLDREAVAAENLRRVRERADRERNLARFEATLVSLVETRGRS